MHFALDDFGTGYASLLHLNILPVDRLKVDRRLVAGLGSSDRDPTIVATIVELAHKLGLAVVAEGIETEDELRAVRDMGCDEVQGFLLARPGPPQFSVRSAGAADGPGPPVGPSRGRPIESPEHAPLGGVQLGELGEQLVVDGAPGRVGVVGGLDRHQRADLRRATQPRAMPASKPLPRRLAWRGSATCSMGRPSTEA